MGLGIGKALNSLTGASDSAKQANRYNYQLSQLSYKQQKEFAQNAHQWEMQDLEKAGLNPALTTGASSAGAIAGGGSTGNSASVGAGQGIGILSSIFDTVNSTRATSANIDGVKATAELNRAQALATIEMLPINKKEKEAYIKLLGAQTTSAKGSKENIIGSARELATKLPIIGEYLK